MKKTLVLKLLASVVAVVSLTAVASAAGFSKTQEYPNGKFADVPEKQWYAAEVKSAYELGLMNGQSDTAFGPDGNVTVAEGVTMASRVHSIYNGKEIKAVSGGKWYDMYIAYAKENGLIEEGQFTNYDRNIMRYEMAVMFAKAMPASYFTAKNAIKDIPDVAETEEYYDELMMLYKAGVVLGSDDYGNFYATNPIKRSETAAIINRVALPANRKAGELLEYGDRDQAVFLIDDSRFGSAPHSGIYFASGWIVEDLGSVAFNEVGSIKPVLTDDSDKRVMYAHRDIQVQTKGKVMTELNYSVAGSGSKFMFKDSDGKVIAEIVHKNAKLFLVTDKQYDLNVSLPGGNVWVYTELDLDADTIYVAVDGVEIGTYPVIPPKDLATLTAGTTLEEEGTLSMGAVHMWVNYDVYDVFRANKKGSKPFGWETEGNVAAAPVSSSTSFDAIGVSITDAGKMIKKFEPVTGKFVYETFLLVPKGQSAYVALYNGEKEAVKVSAAADGKFIALGKELRKFNNAVWQQVRVEADTSANTALIKINGKNTQTVSFNEDSVDSIVVAFVGKGTMLVDDVELYNVFDYADYCPTPVPVTDDEWIVGMSVCSLWREGTHYGWDCISPYEEITPVLGFYDEGLPEVADWEIKFLVEHGFDFQHYCWYQNTTTDPCKETKLSDAIVDGYMNAKYSDMMDMMIMWENNGMSANRPDVFYQSIWPYWCEWFFSDSRYFTINNKPVITIYQYEQFVDTMGGVAEAKKAVEFMNEDIKRYGFDGVILLACGQFPNYKAEDFKTMRDIGFEARVSYSFGEEAYKSEYQKMKMTACYNQNGLSLFPCIGVGFNDIGWTEGRTPLITPEGMIEVAKWAKDEYMPLIDAMEEQDWMSKFVFYTTWNEYGEGHYIFPSNTHKFGYIDANRAVFSSVAGTNDSKHFDVEPTLNQKARLGYLYPARHTPMRRTQYISSNSAVENNIPVITWDFEKEEDVKKWTIQMNCDKFEYDSAEKALYASTSTNDGAIGTINAEYNVVDADKAKYLHVQIKYEKDTSPKFQMFFIHDYEEKWTADKCLNPNIAILGDGEYHDYYIDLSKNVKWNGIVKDLRFDPMSYAGKFWVKKIEFLSDKTVGTFVMDVDGTERAFAKEFTKKVGDEIYVGGNPSEGFYSLLNLYTEYNRVNGTLDLYGANGSKISFVVGSDVAKVNGKDVKLAMAIERVDGLVTVPVKLICDTFGYEYTIDGDLMKVKVRDISYDDIIAAREPFSYEFDVPGDTEGWVPGAAKGNVVNGCFTITADPVAISKTGYDAQITNKSVNMTARYFNEIQFRIRPTFIDDSLMDTAQGNISIYFTTDKETTADEKKTFKIKWAEMTLDAQGFYTYSIKTSSNANWTSTITSLRFDPSNLGGMFEIDYLRFVADEETKALIEEENRKNTENKVKLMAVDEGAPFFIENADAEDLTSIANLRPNPNHKSGESGVTIVEDDLRAGNHAYLVVPGTTKKTWTYFRAKTRFLPGKTYNVEFDFRLLTDQYGNDASNVSAQINPRYADTINGTFKNMADHPVKLAPGIFSTSDGWVRVKASFTVNETSMIRESDELSIFANPTGGTEDFINYSYMVDNFVITVAE